MLFPFPHFMADQSWVSVYDADPDTAREFKRELMVSCASSQCLGFGSHFPFPGPGRVEKVLDSWRWHALEGLPGTKKLGS